MALVPAELAHHSNLQQHSPTGPTLNQLSLLDQQMKPCWMTTALAQRPKLQQYYSTLRRYSAIQDNSNRSPIPVRIEPPSKLPSPVATKELPALESELLEHVPKMQRQNAKLLVKYIKENPDISWNQNKELVYKGNVVEDSNIYDLVIGRIGIGRTRLLPEGGSNLQKD